MTDLLTVEDMEVRYGSAVAAQRISLVVPQRGTVGLLGANGAGKSTVLKAIAGLIPKSAGRLLLEGTDVTGQDARQLVRAGIVYVPEGREIVPSLSVDENLVLGGFHLDGPTRRRRRDMVLGIFTEIADRAASPAWRLSGGEQQMLAIGRALMAGPRLLLLDEPSLGLAPLLVRRVFEKLAVVRAETGLAMILVEQNFRLTVKVAETVHFMRGGRMLGRRDAAELREPAAMEEAIAAYLGAGEAAVS
jgi:branched-chain amino acid transport system ATP-binding protein